MHREAFVEHGFDRGEHDRQIFRLAPGHHGVDRDLLDRCRVERGRHQPDDLLRVARGAVEHAQDTLLARRHERQPVRPTAREHRLLLVLVIAQFDATRAKPGLIEADLETLDDPRLYIFGATARTLIRQPVAEPNDTREALPFAAVPAIGPRDLAAAFEADQGRHDLDFQPVRHVKREVVHRGGHRVGEGGIVLCENGQPGAAGQFAEHRRGQLAGRAIALDDRHQPILR